ncbi:MAG TPA: class I SAM-dependent methyltransferase [Pseudonocardiaceae bacterium]|jgi:trans-aconitate methyltransferase|nr:class I SAM-dependent methyltransferase [Pseudonocardiaceae bacterium]
MTTTLDAQFARSWVSRWDAQQEFYITDREERFAVIGDVVTEVLRTTKPTAGATVIDLGCGPGSLSARLAARLPALRVIGLDTDPLLLALGRARYGYRVEFVDTDLTADDLPEQVPAVIEAAVSTTALHWLDPEPLAALYRNLAARIRSGGVFVNGDHMPASDPRLAELTKLVKEGRRTRTGNTDNEDWEQWWSAAQSEPELADLITQRSDRAIAHHGSNSLSPAEHAELLRAAGFSAVGPVWQSGDDTVLVAIR